MFYTYLWLREDGTPYYVGKGKGNRGFTSHKHRQNCPPLDHILIQEFLSEDDAFEAEKLLIAYYGRIDLGTGCLRNMTPGGDHPPSALGRAMPESQKRAASVIHRKNLIGQEFGRLVVHEFDEAESIKHRRPMWLCKCRCGILTSVSAGHLRSGKIKSCGCINKEMIAARNRTLFNLGKTYRKKGILCLD